MTYWYESFNEDGSIYGTVQASTIEEAFDKVVSAYPKERFPSVGSKDPQQYAPESIRPPRRDLP